MDCNLCMLCATCRLYSDANSSNLTPTTVHRKRIFDFIQNRRFHRAQNHGPVKIMAPAHEKKQERDPGPFPSGEKNGFPYLRTWVR